MKSFRLDTDFSNDAVESWPALLIALAIRRQVHWQITVLPFVWMLLWAAICAN